MLSANHGRKRAARRVHDSVELKSGACQNGNLIAAGHVKVDKFKIDKFDRENRCFVLNAPPAMSGTRGCPLSAPKRHCISMRSRPKIGTAGAFLESNTCVIDQKYFFVLGCLEIPVDGENESFSWGVWVSLRKDRFAEFVCVLRQAEAIARRPVLQLARCRTAALSEHGKSQDARAS
jgi:hypothetical protein